MKLNVDCTQAEFDAVRAAASDPGSNEIARSLQVLGILGLMRYQLHAGPQLSVALRVVPNVGNPRLVVVTGENA